MIDALAIVGDGLFGTGLALEDHLARVQALGMHGAVVAPARSSDYRFEPANDRLAAAVPDSAPVRWLARVDPNRPAPAIAELRRCAGLGAAGMYLDADQDVFRVTEAAPVVAAATELGLPVVMVAGVPLRAEPLQFDALAREVPNARIVLTSGGQVNVSGLGMTDAWLALTRNPNLSVLSNGEYRQDYLERIAAELGPERLLFASMAPVYDTGFELTRIRSARFRDVDRARIEHANAAQLFGFSGDAVAASKLSG